MTAGWPVTSVVMDIVRIDVAAPEMIGFQARIEFVRPVTRGGGTS
jgi:hypothetical protein